jgi:hypothetical protein
MPFRIMRSGNLECILLNFQWKAAFCRHYNHGGTRFALLGNSRSIGVPKVRIGVLKGTLFSK